VYHCWINQWISHMNTNAYVLGGALAAAAVVAGAIFYLQSFDAEKVACEDIAEARASLQSAYDSGVAASVQVYADEKAMIDERLSQCLSAKPVDPCADAQAARDAAVVAYNNIPSPKDDAPYEEFQTYFNQREAAYQNYKSAKAALDACRAANPPKTDVPYEQSDTKACFDAYDAEVEAARDVFSRDTNAMRTALSVALAGLDAREKACHPPEGGEKFTSLHSGGGTSVDGNTAEDISSCRLLSPDLDTELFKLRERAAAISGEIKDLETSIQNIEKRMSPLRVDLSEVDTYIPPESTKTQFEGALNALRAERKVSIESALEFYENMQERRKAEKEELEAELRDVEARIEGRLAEIAKENVERQRKFPTALHFAKPDECEYYHCHGMLCGIGDPAPSGCGQGATTESDLQCEQFIEAYFKAAGI
jgi:hypothetical protein